MAFLPQLNTWRLLLSWRGLLLTGVVQCMYIQSLCVYYIRHPQFLWLLQMQHQAVQGQVVCHDNMFVAVSIWEVCMSCSAGVLC